MWHRILPCAALGGAATLLLSGACRRDPTRPPHIVLIMIDTLRARNLGCYGYPRPTTPSIDGLARDAALFENAISVGGNTTTAMPSLFTGRYAFFEYGDVWTEVSYGMERYRRGPRRRSHPGRSPPRSTVGLGLPKAMTTVAEYLSTVGYRTAGFITNPYLKSTFSMQQGFGHYEEVLDTHGEPDRAARAPRVLERALGFLGSVDLEQPTFLYLHFMDTHEPYREPDPAVVGPLPDSFTRVRHDELWRSWDKLANVGEVGHEFELKYMTAAYDSALRQVDEAVGGLHRYYRERGLLESTLFVITSDHGEEFLEHGGTGHKGSLFEEILHVPLVVRAPGGLRRTRLSQLVRNFDVAPTLLDYAGIPRPATMDARSLRPALEGRSFDGPTTAYANFPGIRMIRTERYKLLRHEDGSELLFDLATDPGETTSLTRSTDATVQGTYLSLARAMDRTVEKLRRQGVSKRGPLEAVALDEATRAQLRALGYVE